MALYLKQCGACLRQYVGGVKRPAEKLSVFVSLTRSGLPRIIPAHHRKIIARRDARSDQVTQWYLSWFTLSILVCLAPKVSRATFKSIIEPIAVPSRVLSVCEEISERMSWFVRKYIPWISTIPIRQGMSWVPTRF